jgi:hypothetical protein
LGIWFVDNCDYQLWYPFWYPMRFVANFNTRHTSSCHINGHWQYEWHGTSNNWKPSCIPNEGNHKDVIVRARWNVTTLTKLILLHAILMQMDYSVHIWSYVHWWDEPHKIHTIGSFWMKWITWMKLMTQMNSNLWINVFSWNQLYGWKWISSTNVIIIMKKKGVMKVAHTKNSNDMDGICQMI